MTDPQDLARRYLALWEEYLVALLSDPAADPAVELGTWRSAAE